MTAIAGQDLTVMVPAAGLQSVTVDGTVVDPTLRDVAGRTYALLTSTAPSWRVEATYA